MRLVLDTNVLVSALFWEGNEARLLRACHGGGHDVVATLPILEELARVLGQRFGLGPALIGEYLVELVGALKLVETSRRVSVVKADPADDRILEAALAGSCDLIVSGDRHLLALGSFEGIDIVRAPVALTRVDRS